MNGENGQSSTNREESRWRKLSLSLILRIFSPRHMRRTIDRWICWIGKKERKLQIEMTNTPLVANGIFTYEDLYGGRAGEYHYRPTGSLASTERPPTTSISLIRISHVAKLISSTESPSKSRWTSPIESIPFTYFYWVLLAVAILLTIVLITISVCYCRALVKNYRSRR